MTGEEFNAIRQQFPNDEAVLASLKSYEAFKRVGRTTLHRWARAASLPRRGALAARVLLQVRHRVQTTGPEQGCTIPFFYHATELALPAVIASRALFPGGCAAHLRTKVALVHHVTGGGKDALQGLVSSPTGLALADRSVGKDPQLVSSCLPVCVIARSFPLIFATNRLRTATDWRRVEFYCPEGASLGKKIRHALKRRGVNQGRVGITEVSDPPSPDLHPAPVTKCFVGWGNWMDAVRNRFSPLHQIKSTTLGLSPVSYTLFAKPGALTFGILTQFLVSLETVFSDLGRFCGRKDNAHVQAHLRKPIRDLRASLRDRKVRFVLGKLYTPTVLEFVRREITLAEVVP